MDTYFHDFAAPGGRSTAPRCPASWPHGQRTARWSRVPWKSCSLILPSFRSNRVWMAASEELRNPSLQPTARPDALKPTLPVTIVASRAGTTSLASLRRTIGTSRSELYRHQDRTDVFQIHDAPTPQASTMRLQIDLPRVPLAE